MLLTLPRMSCIRYLSYIIDFSLYAVFKVHKDASGCKNSSALKACFHKQVCFCRHWHVMPWAIRPKILELRICFDWHSSVITYTNPFVYLITGETSFHSTALLIGLARRIVVRPCLYLFLTSAADLPLSFSFKFGGHLLSHTVSSAVPSAVQVLTIVFEMGTGVTPERIATKTFCHSSAHARSWLPLESAPLLLDRFKPSHMSCLSWPQLQTSLHCAPASQTCARSLMTKQ